MTQKFTLVSALDLITFIMQSRFMWDATNQILVRITSTEEAGAFQ